jgi:ribosomal protein S18 acetylase RimI-like enzyme
MPEIRTRIAALEDVAALALLNAEFNGSRLPAEHYAARLACPDRVDTPILAELDDAVVGFASLRLLTPVFYREAYAEVTELYVVEAARQRGIGRRLLAHAERLALEAGADELVVLTGRDNPAALGLYRAMGFRVGDLALSKKVERSTPHGQES